MVKVLSVTWFGAQLRFGAFSLSSRSATTCRVYGVKGEGRERGGKEGEGEGEGEEEGEGGDGDGSTHAPCNDQAGMDDSGVCGRNVDDGLASGSAWA